LLALIYKGWRKSGRPSVRPNYIPHIQYILRWSPGNSNRKPTRTKAAVRYGNYGSGSERGNRYIAESRPVLLFQRRTDSFLCSFTPSRPSVMHCVTLPTILSQPLTCQLSKFLRPSHIHRYTYTRLQSELCASSERHPAKRHENQDYSCPLSSVFFTATRYKEACIYKKQE